MWGGWGVERMHRCLRLLGETPAELAASIAMSASTFNSYLKRGLFPGPVALLCHMREQDFLRARGAGN